MKVIRFLILSITWFFELFRVLQLLRQDISISANGIYHSFFRGIPTIYVENVSILALNGIIGQQDIDLRKQ
ncbi:MAG: hypothetical protein ABSF21_05545 [Dehalococcoidia bacterium]